MIIWIKFTKKCLKVLFFLKKLKIISKKIQITPSINGNRVTFQANIKTNAKVLENTGILDLDKPEIIQMIEQKLNTHIKKTITEFTKQMLHKSTDSLYLGLVLARNEQAIWKTRVEQHWHQVLPHSVSIHSSIHSKIKQIGIISKILDAYKKGKQHE